MFQIEQQALLLPRFLLPSVRNSHIWKKTFRKGAMLGNDCRSSRQRTCPPHYPTCVDASLLSPLGRDGAHLAIQVTAVHTPDKNWQKILNNQSVEKLKANVTVQQLSSTAHSLTPVNFHCLSKGYMAILDSRTYSLPPTQRCITASNCIYLPSLFPSGCVSTLMSLYNKHRLGLILIQAPSTSLPGLPGWSFRLS